MRLFLRTYLKTLQYCYVGALVSFASSSVHAESTVPALGQITMERVADDQEVLQTKPQQSQPQLSIDLRHVNCFSTITISIGKASAFVTSGSAPINTEEKYEEFCIAR